MARSLLVAAVLVALALGANAQIDCYVTTVFYPPPPPPSPPITGIPPITIPPIPSARDYMTSYLQTWGNPVTLDGSVAIGQFKAAPTGIRAFQSCLQYDYTYVLQVTAPADAAGIRIKSTGRVVLGSAFTCAQINAPVAVPPSPPSPPLSAGCFTWNNLYTYQICPVQDDESSTSCCSTNLCNDGGATVTTQLAASSAIANLVLLALSALACLVLSKML